MEFTEYLAFELLCLRFNDETIFRENFSKVGLFNESLSKMIKNSFYSILKDLQIRLDVLVIRKCVLTIQKKSLYEIKASGLLLCFNIFQ